MTLSHSLAYQEDGDLLGNSSAVLSEDGAYRYLLTRRWGDGPDVTFVMLNPSTADAFASDPTCTRAVGFARRWQAGALTIVNLFALRATDPRELRKHPDPVGPANDEFILRHCRPGCLVVVAWGADAAAAERGREVACILLAAGATPVCLGVTASGQPRHPLYVRGDAPLTSWPVPASQPKDPRSGADLAVASPSGPGAAADSTPAAAAPGASAPPRAGVRGTTRKRTAGTGHPPAPAVPETSPPAPVGATGGARERGPGAPDPGAGPSPAQQAPVPGAVPGFPGTGPEPAGGAVDRHDASLAGTTPALRGEAWRKAVRQQQAANAKARRNARGRYPVKRTGANFRPGSARRMPPPPGGAT